MLHVVIPYVQPTTLPEGAADQSAGWRMEKPGPKPGL